METKRLTDTLSVSSQITVGDIAAIKAAGFRSIVCNRPDGEERGQPPFAQIETSAREAGLEIRNLPIVPARMSERDAAAFAALMHELPAPVLAYCRTGARSQALAATLPADLAPGRSTVAAAGTSNHTSLWLQALALPPRLWRRMRGGQT